MLLVQVAPVTDALQTIAYRQGMVANSSSISVQFLRGLHEMKGAHIGTMPTSKTRGVRHCAFQDIQ
jgi:hypothetical protein